MVGSRKPCDLNQQESTVLFYAVNLLILFLTSSISLPTSESSASNFFCSYYISSIYSFFLSLLCFAAILFLYFLSKEWGDSSSSGGLMLKCSYFIWGLIFLRQRELVDLSLEDFSSFLVEWLGILSIFLASYLPFWSAFDSPDIISWRYWSKSSLKKLFIYLKTNNNNLLDNGTFHLIVSIWRLGKYDKFDKFISKVFIDWLSILVVLLGINFIFLCNVLE